MRKKPTVIIPTPISLDNLGDEELITLRAALDVELRRRSLAVSVGEVGEKLAINFFKTTPTLPNLQPAPPGTKNVDALSRAGDRYSIKTVCNAKKTSTIYPDADDPDKALFEYLLLVRLSPEWTMQSVHQFSWVDFVKARSWDKRMNAWYIATSSKSLAHGRPLL